MKNEAMFLFFTLGFKIKSLKKTREIFTMNIKYQLFLQLKNTLTGIGLHHV